MIQHAEIIENTGHHVELKIDIDGHSVYVIDPVPPMPNSSNWHLELAANMPGLVFHVKKIDPDTIIIIDGPLSGMLAKRK